MKDKIIKGPNLNKILNKSHQNKWVALSTDYKKVLAVSANLSSVLKAVPQKKKVIMKVLPNLSYAPSVF